MQILHWSGNYWLESRPSYELSTQQKHDRFPLDLFLHILIIYKLHGSPVYIDIRVCLMFIIIWLWMNDLGEVSVAKKSSINQKLVAWEVRG